MMIIRPFFDPVTFTLTYVVYDATTRDAIVIDPVLDYDPLSASTSTQSVAAVAFFLRSEKLKVHLILETHAHADHLSGSQFLKRHFPDARIAIGAKITVVQSMFKNVLDLGPSFAADGSQFDKLIEDGEKLQAGSLTIEAIATPGHTPACMTYKIDDAIFTGDALFIEDYGTGRCDFPGGSADALYTSIHERLYHLPDSTRVFVGHDYQPGGRSPRYETTIGRSKALNAQLRNDTTRADFVKTRTERDAKLGAPRLLYPSVQVNVNAGRLPSRHANGHRYFTIPVDLNVPSKNKNSSNGSDQNQSVEKPPQ
jgi:glyoxylase-like metal-dependent hydrolase (beta-lactamase superfamily II)